MLSLSIKDRGCQAATIVYTSCGGAWFNGQRQAVLCLLTSHLCSSQGRDYNRFLTSVKGGHASEYELDGFQESRGSGGTCNWDQRRHGMIRSVAVNLRLHKKRVQ